jgi:hypothetical protein
LRVLYFYNKFSKFLQPCARLVRAAREDTEKEKESFSAPHKRGTCFSLPLLSITPFCASKYASIYMVLLAHIVMRTEINTQEHIKTANVMAKAHASMPEEMYTLEDGNAAIVKAKAHVFIATETFTSEDGKMTNVMARVHTSLPMAASIAVDGRMTNVMVEAHSSIPTETCTW